MKNKILFSLLILLVISPLALFGCESPTSGSEQHLSDGGILACEGADLPPPERAGAWGTVDGEAVFLRSQAGLYTSAEVLSSAPYRHCPVCITNNTLACARHWEDVDCSLLPAFVDPTPCSVGATNVQSRISEGSNVSVSWTCGTQSFGRTLTGSCGCDDPTGVSGDIVLCPNGDGWNVREIIGI